LGDAQGVVALDRVEAEGAKTDMVKAEGAETDMVEALGRKRIWKSEGIQVKVQGSGCGSEAAASRASNRF
jgi:hypothetical protein